MALKYSTHQCRVALLHVVKPCVDAWQQPRADAEADAESNPFGEKPSTADGRSDSSNPRRGIAAPLCVHMCEEEKI